MVNASGRFRARAKDEKFCAESPRPGRKMMALVGCALGGRWMMGERLVGKSVGLGMARGGDMLTHQINGPGCPRYEIEDEDPDRW